MVLTTLTLVGTLAGLGWAAGQAQNRQQGPTVVTPTVPPLTAAEKTNILLTREEEKLARDVYRTLAEMYDCPTFKNIAAAEQRHLEAMGLLVTKYGLTDPVTDDTVGVFGTPKFTVQYKTLTESGAKSLLDALKAGVQIEQADIADLKKALSETDKSDLKWILGNLQRGSTNHLRAFTRNVETGGAACPNQGVSGNAGNGKGPGHGICPGCGRGGRGNGNGWRNGNGNRGPNGPGQGNGPRGNGACLMLNSAQL
jgi:hypothetical protein